MTGYPRGAKMHVLVTVLVNQTSYMERSAPMDGIVFVEISAVILAVFGALASLFGSDSREGVEDTHQTRDTRGNR